MDKLNEILDMMATEMWKKKDNIHLIEMQDLLDFYKTYHHYANLVTDLLNTKIICSGKNISSAQKDLIIEAFKEVNGYKYNRLLIDSLLELDDELSIKYLLNILSFEDTDNRSKFTDDFSHHPSFGKIMALIESNENKQVRL